MTRKKITSVADFLSLVVAILLAGFLDYEAGNLLRRLLNLPLFFDMIFSTTLLFFVGLVPAILSLGVYYVILYITRLFYGENFGVILFYFFAGVAILIVTFLVIRKIDKEKTSATKTFFSLLLTAILSALANSVVAGTINYLIFKYYSDYTFSFDVLILALHTHKFPLLFSCIVGRIPVSVLDRIIAIFAGFGISCALEKLFHKIKN